MRSAGFLWATMVLVTAACDGLPGVGDGDGDDDERGQTVITVEVPLEGIPPSGECTHITSVRLADFATRNYIGPLAGATFNAPKGETRITATAYAPPCDPEPAEPNWIADEQIVFLVEGANTIHLDFRPNVAVGVDPIFWDDQDPQLVIQPGSEVRTGRNFEDGASPSYAIDGWDVMQVTLPPTGGGGTPTTSMLFSTRTSPLPYTPRGMARLPDGRFVFQVAESNGPLQVFDGAGNWLESWPVQRDPGMIQFDSTDGLERIDATHLVRTAFLNVPLNCPDFEGPDCIQSAIEILELRSGPSGNFVAVSQQFLLPFPYNVEYPLGVAPGPSGSFIVSTLPGGPDTRLLRLDAAGALIAGPVMLAGSNEGLFLNAAGGKLAALTYKGMLSMHVPSTLAPRAGEVLSYLLGAGVSIPLSLAWNSSFGEFLSVDLDNQVVRANQTFTFAEPIGFDSSGYTLVSGLDLHELNNELIVLDRIPPIDPGTGQRLARMDRYDLFDSGYLGSTILQGVPADVRQQTLSVWQGPNAVLTHYRRPGGVLDASLDSTIFVHAMSGSLMFNFNLAAWGVRRILSLSALPVTNEIALMGTDQDGTVRLMVIDATGTPVRSYRTDGIHNFTDMAPITSGPFAGQVGVVTGQPSSFLRIASP